MYSNGEILVLEGEKFNYSNQRLTEIFDIEFDKIKVLSVYGGNEERYGEIKVTLNKFKNLERIVLFYSKQIYDLILFVLKHTSIIVDLRELNNKFVKYNIDLIKKLLENTDSLNKERLLIFWCQDCKSNFYNNHEERCQKCSAYDDFLKKKFEKNKYSCYDSPKHSYPSEELERSNELYCYIKNTYYDDDQKRDLFLEQELKTSLFEVIDNIPDDIIKDLSINNETGELYPEYKNLSLKDIKRGTIKYLKSYKITFKEDDWPRFHGPIFNLMGMYGEPFGWFYLVSELVKFYNRNNITFYVRQQTETRRIDRDSIKSLNLMLEKYQYRHKCSCTSCVNY